MMLKINSDNRIIEQYEKSLFFFKKKKQRILRQLHFYHVLNVLGINGILVNLNSTYKKNLILYIEKRKAGKRITKKGI